MPTLQLTPPGGGNPVNVQVDDSFTKLSPDAQAAAVEEMSSKVFPQLSAAASPNNSAAPQPAAPAAPASQTSDDPLTALRNSAGDIVSGVGKLGGLIDTAANKYLPAALTQGQSGPSAADQAVQNAGQDIHGDTQFAGNSIHNIGSDLAKGNIGGAAYNAAGALASAAPYAAAGAVPYLGPALLGAAGAGNTIDSRMKAQNETTPSAGDVAAGTADAALNAVAGPAAHGIMSGVAKKALGPLADSLMARLGLSAAAGGAVGAGNNIANNAGTGNLDPSSVAHDAIEGAGTGALAGTVTQTGQAAAGKVAQLSADSAQADLNPEVVASRARVSGMLNDAAAQVANVRGGHADPIQAINSVVQDLHGQLKVNIKLLQDQGLINASQKQAIFGPLLNQSVSAKNSPSLSDDDTPDTAAATALDRFNKLGIDPQEATPIRQGLMDLDTLSQNKLRNQAAGPFAKIGGFVGKGVGGMLPEVLGMHVPGAGFVEDIAGFNLGGQAGKYVGGKIDSALGLNTPPITKQGQQATDYLARQGQSPGQNTLQLLQDQQARLTPPPVDPQAQAAQAQADALARMVQAAKIKQAAQANAQAVKDEAKLAKMRTAQRGADVAAAFGLSPEQAAINKATTNNETALRAADTTPNVPDAGMTAINAAVNQAVAKARAIRAAAGEPDEAAGQPAPTPSGVASATPAPQPAAQPQAAPQAPVAPSQAAPDDRRSSLADYLGHTAIAGPGVQLSPADVQAGLDAAHATGDLNSAQHAFYSQSLTAPLDNPGGVHNANLNTILAHAIAAKTGTAATPSEIINTGPKSAGTSAPVGSTSVRDVVKYGWGAKSNQMAYLKAHTVANLEGRPKLASAALHMMAESDPAQRFATFSRLSEDDQNRARELLNPKLIGEAK